MRILTATLLIAGLASCSNSSNERAVEEKLGVGASVSADVDLASPESAPRQRPSPVAPTAVAVPDSLRATLLIRTGHARIEVDSLEAAIAAVQRMAERLGGYITAMATQTGEERIREATLTARIPSARFDEALSGLEPLGDVESVNVQSEDVGEEFVDVSVRLENGRRLERRLLELLQTRTGKLEEVLAVERELARVREEIERLEGRLRYLRSRVDMSTLTVTVHEPIPLLSDYHGHNVLLRSFARAWRNFLGLVAGFIASLGIILPVAVVAGSAWWWIRRRKTVS